MIRYRAMRAWLNSLRKARLGLAAAICLLFGLAGCGGGGGSNSSAIRFAPLQLAPPASLGLSVKASIAAVVTKDPASRGVDWSVSCTPGKAKGADCGSITSHTASGYPTTYAAPAGDLTANSIPVGGTVTITATSTADPSQSVTATIQIVLKPISVGFNTLPPVAVQTGTVLSVVPVVVNDLYKIDGSLYGADLSLTCASPGACGTISPLHTDGISTGSGALYTAPSIIPLGDTVTITATSTADPTKSVFAIITITQAPLTVALSQTPTPNLPAGAATNLTAIVNFDPNNAGVDWTLACQSDSCGSLSLVHTASGVLTTYTAPTTVPPGNAVTITASSTTSPETTANAVVTVTPANLRNDLLNGQYAFLLRGVRAGGPWAIAGTLQADGIGNISTAFESVLGENSPYTLKGTYFIGSDGRGAITLNGAPTGLGYWYNGQQIFKVTAVSSGHLLMEEFDGYYNADLHIPYGGTLSGTIDQQSAAGFHVPSSGVYSFLLSGVAAKNRPAFYGGTLTGSSYTFTMDRSIAGVIDSISSNTYGTVSFIPSSDGSRGTVRMGPYSFNYYVVDSEHWILIAQAGSDDLASGHMYLQPSAVAIPVGAYAFTQAGATPLSQGSVPLAMGGIFSCDAQGSLAGALDANINGTLDSAQVSGSCAMTTSGLERGRGLLTITGAIAQQFAIYPTASHGILMLELDLQNSGTGVALPQTTGTNATASLLAGNYAAAFQAVGPIGGANSGVGPSNDFLGLFTPDGVSAFGGTVALDQFDENSRTFWTQTADASLTGSFTVGPQGRFTGTLAAPPLEASPYVFYILDNSTVLSLGEGPTPATGILQLQQF